MVIPLLGCLALSGWCYTDFHASVNFAFWAFSEVRLYRILRTSRFGHSIAVCNDIYPPSCQGVGRYRTVHRYVADSPTRPEQWVNCTDYRAMGSCLRD